jgi:transposase
MSSDKVASSLEERDASVRDGYRAFLWILHGVKRGEVAKRLEVSRVTIREWVKRYNAEGVSRTILTPQYPSKLCLNSTGDFC